MKMLNLNKGLWRCFPHPQRDDDAGNGNVDGYADDHHDDDDDDDDDGHVARHGHRWRLGGCYCCCCFLEHPFLRSSASSSASSVLTRLWRFSADAAADVAQLATAAGLLRQLCVSV